MKKTVYLRLTLVLFLTVMTLLSFSASAEDASFGNEAPTLELLVSSDDDEGVEIILKLNSEHGLAAILAELNYDGEDFLFLGCGSDIMTVTYSDVGDGVRFLLDLSENSPSECVLATFYFKKIGSGGGDFSLNIGDDADCLYFEEGNRPVPAKPTLCGVKTAAERMFYFILRSMSEKNVLPRALSFLPLTLRAARAGNIIFWV